MVELRYMGERWTCRCLSVVESRASCPPSWSLGDQSGSRFVPTDPCVRCSTRGAGSSSKALGYSLLQLMRGLALVCFCLLPPATIRLLHAS